MADNVDGERAPNDSRFWNIPAEMRALPQWCVSDASKAPLSVGGDGKLYNASVKNPGEWLTFEVALAFVERHRNLVTTHTDKEGHKFSQTGLNIGFVLTAADPFACIDLDVVTEATQVAKGQPVDPSKWTTKQQTDRYLLIVKEFDSYTELSRSGLGAHIIVMGNIGQGCKRDGVEVYSQDRFIIFTGSVWIDRPVADKQELLSVMVSEMRPPDYEAVPLPDEPERMDDAALIDRAMNATNGAKFSKLANGKWQDDYGSQSEADMAMMAIIAFYTRNNEQCRRIFRMTELGKREKATKDNRYLNLTLELIRSRQAAERAREDAQRAAFKLVATGGEDSPQGALPPTMDIREMHNALVYIAAEKPMVVFRDNLAVQLPPAGMGALLKHNTTPIQNEKGQIVDVSTFNIWQSSDKRLVGYTLNFDPSAGEFCKAEDGRLALNLYKPRPHDPPPDWQQRIGIFLEHVAFLIQDEVERNRFLDWLAHIEQQPGVLPHNHYLMIATKQGVGRNWLAALLAHVWSGHVAMDFDLKSSLASGFNGQLSRKLLAVVDEINEGGTGERWQHSEKLKSMVTASHRFINVKYGLQHTERNCCRWLLFSNYETALPLTSDDRRWNVIRNPSEPHADEGYYRRLYGTLYPKPDARFVASVREFLRMRTIAAFNPGAHAARNDAKAAVVANSMTTEDENAAAVVSNCVSDLITGEQLFTAIFEFDPDNMLVDTSRKWKLLGLIARRAGLEPMTKPFALFGRPKVKVWIVRNAAAWRDANVLAVEQELCRTG